MERLAQDPTEPGFVQDPYAFYDRARRGGAVFHWTDYDLPCVTSHPLASAILRDRRFGRERPHDAPLPHLADFDAVERHSLLELEPPRHTRLRGLVLRAFTSRRIAALGPEIAALADRLLSTARPECDLLAAYAQPLPVIVIARLLGVPETMAPDLLRWSHAMVAMYVRRPSPAVEARADHAARDFAAFLRDHITARRTRPADDLITHLIAAEEDGARLTTDEMISTCVLLLNAGHEATVHSIGNAVKVLLETRTRFDGSPRMVEELIRYDPPLHLFTRQVYEDAEVMGQTFARGSEVALLLAAANRDPEAYPAPDGFDPARPAKANLSFGAGLHFCVGAPLARLELQIALDRLFHHRRGLRLVERPRYADTYHFHGLERLHVAS